MLATVSTVSGKGRVETSTFSPLSPEMLLTRSQRLPEATLLSVKRLYLRPRRVSFYFLPLWDLLTGSVKTKRAGSFWSVSMFLVERGSSSFSTAASPVVWWVVALFLCSPVGQSVRRNKLLPTLRSFLLFIPSLFASGDCSFIYASLCCSRKHSHPHELQSCKASWFLVLSRRTSHCLKQIITGKVRGSLKGHFFGYSSECLHS